jgi:Pyridoxamine 5'-phosphate oxidase
LPDRFYHWIRHPAARSLASEERTVSGFDHLRGHKYCLLVTYKRSGEAVPTPVWFGLGDGKLYVRSEAKVAKVKRIRNDARVRVARAPYAASRSAHLLRVERGCSTNTATATRRRRRYKRTTGSDARSMKEPAEP